MSLHESTHPLVRYLWESAEARDENGETEAASALLEAARYAEALERSQATPRNEPVAPRIQQLALELYWVAVDHALGPDDVNKDTAVDAMAQAGGHLLNETDQLFSGEAMQQTGIHMP